MKVALVLGAAVWADGIASPTLALRVGHAVALWRAGAVGAICVSGGVGAHGPAEGVVGCELAHAQGVPRRALIAETASRSTVENLALSAPLLAGRGIVLVSSRWHLPRALLAARMLGIRAEASGPKGTMSWGRTLRALVREAAAAPGTAWRAWRWRG